ncbi:hypothetical protein MO163_001939 [Listeria monocytogenes]|nr:hypothetical protein [Listeria seeligeri]EAD8780289.1 hypothetical protein [Listeria monocytogenes]MBC1516898.1 hypothetical protein [Listeria immobilis]EAE1846129.1 hypothetical protein [Listeria monocytogenes]EAF2836017.1 hypothetical protein [Listeria monocytogenes]EAF8400917.1 hypothetical protein [Listeria monocytogenes]
MMTEKQNAYIKSLLTKKEWEINADLEYYINTYYTQVDKATASAIIEYLLSCDDKKAETVSDSKIINWFLMVDKKKKGKKMGEIMTEIRKNHIGFNRMNIEQVFAENKETMVNFYNKYNK